MTALTKCFLRGETSVFLEILGRIPPRKSLEETVVLSMQIFSSNASGPPALGRSYKACHLACSMPLCNLGKMAKDWLADQRGRCGIASRPHCQTWCKREHAYSC